MRPHIFQIYKRCIYHVNSWLPRFRDAGVSEASGSRIVLRLLVWKTGTNAQFFLDNKLRFDSRRMTRRFILKANCWCTGKTRESDLKAAILRLPTRFSQVGIPTGAAPSSGASSPSRRHVTALSGDPTS